MNNTFCSATIGRAKRGTGGFSLVEVTLAVAVVAIGLMGVLGLFPLGMDAVRQSADATQMMSIGQDNLAYFQQMGSTNIYYAGYPAIDPTQVISPLTESYSSNLTADGIWYHVDAIVSTNRMSTISNLSPPPFFTNMIERVQIGVFRISTNLTTGQGRNIGNTNYYVTEVDRYVQ